MHLKENDRTAYVTLNGITLETRSYVLNRINDVTQAIRYLAGLPEMLGPQVDILYHAMFVCERNPSNAKKTLQKRLEGPELVSTETAGELARLGPIQYVTVTLAMESRAIPMLNAEFWMSANLRPDGKPVLSITSEYKGPLDELEIRLGLDE